MQMLAFVAVGLILVGHQKPGVAPQEKMSLFDQVVEVPTGSNGYEDYLRAADALNDPAYSEITRAIDRLANPEAYVDEKTPFPDWAKGKTRLELERMRVNRFEPVLRWIHDGNLKE